MEDVHNFMANGRHSQYFCKWKTTSIILQMEDDLNMFKMEDDINVLKLEDKLNFLLGKAGSFSSSLSSASHSSAPPCLVQFLSTIVVGEDV
jgi:hypothetical protein